ncbi:epidermal growth factor receptor isoform X2 [Hyalella azteca]|uniref:Epidermal growth factor receptor n=1 Tax=Hyalella azteca TaxID=294128 RepID=A0A8B7P391_HYAAZ|nr:epidermal growth factor receptor isoform X2 [Hyalella azteca]
MLLFHSKTFHHLKPVPTRDRFLIFLLLLFSYLEVTNATVFDGRICIGTNGRMSVPSNREHHYRNLRDRYLNCTYVDGNLELTWLQDENLDLSFLQYIREVTGYVLISHVDVKRIALPSLQIIRGRTLFKLAVHDENFALLVTLSKMHTLEMPALRDILEGTVGLFNNYNLCHITTIEWKEIMSDARAEHVFVYNFTEPERSCSCHDSCLKGCWGEGPENCQKFSKLTCSPQCHAGRCYDDGPRDCCHLFCAGGCTGPTQSECLACRNFYDDGECKQECPAMQRYNTITYSWETNPNGKYAYGATCVKDCPEHLLKDNGACVRSCPPKFRAVNGECVPCNGPCPKTCVATDDVHAGNIHDFAGCTILEGSLTILDHSFDGFQQVHDDFTFGEKLPEMHPRELEVFSTLTEVTGFINIQASHPEFTNLSFLRNLETIGGRDLTEYFSALYIVKTSLQSLNLRSLKRIRAGKVYILENKDLCFAANMTWKKLVKQQDTEALLLENNRDYNECKQLGLVCNEECSDDGCWGAGPEECLSCRNFKLQDKCVNNCNEPGMYEKEPGVCSLCHDECLGGCTGPSSSHCKSCRNVKDGPFCYARCPDTKFNEGGQCKPCHQNCVKGCRGPENNIGPRGCISCEKVIINDELEVEKCLKDQESCPDGYFSEWVVHQETGDLQRMAGKTICRKCHPRCKNCSAYGFHTSVCHECLHYKRGEQCEERCPDDHYADEEHHECFKCSSECSSGCRGPTVSDCNACRNYRIYLQPPPGTNLTRFNCSANCPAELPYKIFPEDASDPYCGTDPVPYFLDEESLPAVVGGVIGCVFLFCLFVSVFCYIWWKRSKTKEAAMKMTISMMPFDDNEPLKPTNIKPNLAKLRIVKEAELRKGSVLGYGAFGTVFKGVWVPDGENVKIPVAIKVLREGTDTNVSREILEEAYIMASVDHPNLLQLLAVCMTTKIMMVTQLMPLGALLDYVRINRDKIGSKPLLNWCTQIARGMNYLEERRLVHRDLAARNVLVQTPNLVKITDFGLAKLLDGNEEEYKAAGGKMPIKWLALECIQHRIFTHKSDVWAFGVTVWEILTYGGRPYDDVHAREVPEMLEKGERLPQPAICTIDVYVIMIRCWTLEAEERPTFKELTEDFAKMARDPGRFLVIPGDKLMRLPSYTTQDERDFFRSLSSAIGGDGILMAAEEYLQPKYGIAVPNTSSSTSSEPITPVKKHPTLYDAEMGDDDCFENSPSGDSDANSRPPGYGWVGNVRLDLPVDEDDYLMPSTQPPSSTASSSHQHYMDLLDSAPSGTQAASDYYKHLKNNGHSKKQIAMDNPEYHVMNKRNVAAAVQAANMPQRNGVQHRSYGEYPPITHPSQHYSSRRRPSQRSSHSSQPHTPTDTYFPTSTSDPNNFCAFQRTASDMNTFRVPSNPSNPSTPTDSNFPGFPATTNGGSFVGFHNGLPATSNNSHILGPMFPGVQTVGVPVIDPHSRLPSYSSTGSSGPGSGGPSMGSNGPSMGSNGHNAGSNILNLGSNGHNMASNGFNIGSNGLGMGPNGFNVGFNGSMMGSHGNILGSNGHSMGSNGLLMGSNHPNINSNGPSSLQNSLTSHGSGSGTNHQRSHQQPNGEASHEYYNDLTRGYGGLQPSSPRSETTV